MRSFPRGSRSSPIQSKKKRLPELLRKKLINLSFAVLISRATGSPAAIRMTFLDIESEMLQSKLRVVEEHLTHAPGRICLVAPLSPGYSCLSTGGSAIPKPSNPQQKRSLSLRDLSDVEDHWSE